MDDTGISDTGNRGAPSGNSGRPDGRAGDTSIVVADDHPIVLQGLRSLLTAEPGLRLMGEAADGQSALRLVEELAPDVLVADLKMPGLTGLELVRQAAERFPKTRVMILSIYGDDAYVQEALRGGAAGYVLKEALAAELVDAVKVVAGGGRYLCRRLTERAVAAYSGDKATSPDPYGALSEGEREVLRLTAEGHTGAEVAGHLFVSPRTVETRRQNAMRKLGLRTTADLVRFALRRGILPPDP